MDKNLNLYVYSRPGFMIGVVEKYVSLIWTIRYDEAGEFELETIYTPELRALLIEDNLVSTDLKNRFAIIQSIEIEKDDDGNATMIVKGKTIEIIMDRRLILKILRFGDENIGQTANIQQSMKKIIDDNIIDPTDPNRKISDFVFVSSRDYAVTSLEFAETFHQISVYEAISNTCKDNHIGFKLLLNNNGEFYFSLFKGRDLSGKVLFSPYYDNINNTKFSTDSEAHKNTLITTNESGDTLVITNEESMPYGLDRKEVFENLGELKDNSKEVLTDQEIEKKAIKKLNLEYKKKTGFDGEIITDVFYKYEEDYDVGDRVWIEDEYGNTEAVYISEIVITCDENGLTIIPTFKEIDWNWEEE